MPVYFFIGIKETMFKRKAYSELKRWKEEFAPDYACLIEGARRVGKTTIAEEFAKKEYKSYIKIDFSDITDSILEIFKDIAKRDLFFLRLQTETGIQLFERKSAIIFDEVQLYPKARQAIKFLVKDGRYDYIETGSLISIRKNVKDILIPSEEHRITVHPMDYEEFLWACGKSSDTIRAGYLSHVQMGNALNTSLMRDFRTYMAVGGMPQAVDCFVKTNNFERVDEVKQEIIDLYKADLLKIDPSGRLTDIYQSVPQQLAMKKKRFVISRATGKKRTTKDEERLYDLIGSQIVTPCYNVTTPSLAPAQDKKMDDFKLYLSDTGLFTTMIFSDSNGSGKDIYRKLLSDKLPANLGYLYENAVAQAISAQGRDLYFHSWKKDDSTHSFEVDFLLRSSLKIIPVEVKSSATNAHESIDAFCVKYSSIVGRRVLFSQKDTGKVGALELKPIYQIPFFLEEIQQEKKDPRKP